MPNFKEIVSKNVNGINVSLYDIDLNDADNKQKLEEQLITKIQSMKIHEKAENYSNCIPQNILDEYRNAFNSNIAMINPVANRSPSRPQFSPRRSRVTEFLAQMVLTKKEFCIFYDEVDKKILMSPLDDDAHAKGIDITGIKKEPSGIKFVACELKASKDKEIPCSSASKVLNDIKKAYKNEENRLSKEIHNFLISLKDLYDKDENVRDILLFLYKLLAESNNREILLQRVLFVPFLIRQNEDIVQDQNLGDFQEFNLNDFENANIKGLILSFDTDITNFSNLIYNKAVSDNE